MSKFIILLLMISISGCLAVAGSKGLNNDLDKKNTQEILNILIDHDVSFIGEPPCSLSRIMILSREKMVLVSLKYKDLPINLIERIPKCNWKIEEFYEYTPSEILIESVDQDYIRRSNIKH